MLFDPDAPDTLAHIGLIDVEQLRLSQAYDGEVSGLARGVSGPSAPVTGGNQTGPIPSAPLPGNVLDARYRGNGNAHLEEGAFTRVADIKPS